MAILCGDLHLSHKPPVARSCEGDWYGVMAGYLGQLTALTNVGILEPPLPIICAGDVFDKWNSPAELINFAIRHLPPMFAVPGQHDLPLHRYDDVKKSAYWTLCEAGNIVTILADFPLGVGSLVLHGFPFGFEPEPLVQRNSLTTEIAVVHGYIWSPRQGTGHPDAAKSSSVAAWGKKLKGYDVAVFGDNHSHFAASSNGCRIWNCGGFIRRRSDEVYRRPCVGLLRSDGTITRHDLDVSADKFLLVRAESTVGGPDADKLIDELKGLADAGIDFARAIRAALDRESVSDAVRDVVLAALEGK